MGGYINIFSYDAMAHDIQMDHEGLKDDVIKMQAQW